MFAALHGHVPAADIGGGGQLLEKGLNMPRNPPVRLIRLVVHAYRYGTGEKEGGGKDEGPNLGENFHTCSDRGNWRWTVEDIVHNQLMSLTRRGCEPPRLVTTRNNKAYPRPILGLEMRSMRCRWLVVPDCLLLYGVIQAVKRDQSTP